MKKMGRKLDLGQLTEEEEKVILQVIQRDYDVRKVESDRIGKLSKNVEEEEQKQKDVVKGAVQGEVPIDTLCAKCGSKFMWLINPKSQCQGCDLYFCKNKIDCIVYDKITKKCFCNACLKQRELHSYAGDWFYDKLKGKFRRHGGAKVSRELQKRKKTKSSEGENSPAPPKPQRLGLNDSKFGSPPSSVPSTPASVRRQPSDASQNEISRTPKEETNAGIEPQGVKLAEEYDEQADAVVVATSLDLAPEALTMTDIEIQTDDLDTINDKLPEIKEELEATISRILLPKLEELKRSQIEHQTEVDRQQKVEDAVRLAEEMIDRALERALEKHGQRSAFQPNSARSSLRESSSLREAGTMTETSDSEMDSLSSASGRKRSPKNLPLSERLGNLSPESLRRSIERNQNSSSMNNFTQGIVLQKTQLVARAELDNALGEILGQQGVPVNGPNSPQEFSTELKFTAVGGGKRRFRSGDVSDSNSDSDDTDRQEDDDILTNNENWSTPELGKRPPQFGKTSNTVAPGSLVSLKTDGKSPYDALGSDDSDSDSKERVYEEQVLASFVRRPDGPTSPQALMSPQIEVFESLPEKKPRLPVEVAVNSAILDSMSRDLNLKSSGVRKEPESTSPPVVEDLVFAVDKTVVESQISVEEVTEEVFNQVQPRPKSDHESSSDSSDSDESESSSSKNSARLNRNSFLQPQRLTKVTQEQKVPASQLSYDDALIVDRDDFGDRFAEMLAQKQREQQLNDPRGSPFNTRESVSSLSDNESSGKKDAESSSSSDDEESQAPAPSEVKPGIEESAVGLRIVNGKSLQVLTDAIEKIEDAKRKEGSDSSSNSSKSSRNHSVGDIAEEIHELNKAEEAIYKNAAETYAMEERLDQMERVATGLNRSDPGLKQMLLDLDAEIETAESQVEEIKHGGKSIEAIMQELRGAGLQVDRGGFKRTSLDSAPSPRSQEREPQERQSFPAMSQPLRHVDTPDPDRRSWQRNTVTIIPGTRSVPVEEPLLHSTPKQTKLSSSSSSSLSSGAATPISPRTQAMKQKPFHQTNTEPTELQAPSIPTIVHVRPSSAHSSNSSHSAASFHRVEEKAEDLHKDRPPSADSAHSNSAHHNGAAIPVAAKSRHSSHSSHSSVSSHSEEKVGPFKLDRPSSANSSHSSHSRASSKHTEEVVGVKVAAEFVPPVVRPSSAHSSHSEASSHRHEEASLALEKLRPSSARSSTSSHSVASSHHFEESTAVKVLEEVKAALPSSLRSSSSHSSSSEHSSIQPKAKVESQFEISSSLKSPSTHSSHSGLSVHSNDRASNSSRKAPIVQSARSLYSGDESGDELANISVASVSERRKMFESGGITADVNPPSSVSSHSSSSAHSSLPNPADSKSSVNGNDHGQMEVSVVPPAQTALSSHSASSFLSGMTSSSDVHSDAEEELSRISYQAGLSAEELEEARVPTPVPRRKKEIIHIEETIVLPASEPRVKKTSESSENRETAVEIIAATQVGEALKEKKRSSSSSSNSSSSKSGTEHTNMKEEPLLKHQINSDSESSESNASRKGKRKSKIMKDDSWMKSSKNNSDDDLGETASRISVATDRSSRSGMFHNLTAAQQREMARIALLHCEETAIAEDRFKTKTINVVRKPEEEVEPQLPAKKTVVPTIQVSPSVPEVAVREQREILPTLAPHDIVTVAEVRVERSSSSSSGSSTESAKNSPAVRARQSHQGNGSAFRIDSSKLKQTHNGNASNNIRSDSPSNTLHVTESPADIDRNVRGSITMRGGRMVMTTSPDSKPEFQVVRKTDSPLFPPVMRNLHQVVETARKRNPSSDSSTSSD